MKKASRLAVVIMCVGWLLSLFGCGKEKPFMLDGPDMERTLWSEFTVSRYSETYETIYYYTVKCDESSDRADLYVKISEGQTVEKSIQLEEETVSSLFNLNLMGLPNAKQQEGSFVGLSTIDSYGQAFDKDLSSAMEQEILTLILPYVEALTSQ